jgi:hypothetical protein
VIQSYNEALKLHLLAPECSVVSLDAPGRDSFCSFGLTVDYQDLVAPPSYQVLRILCALGEYHQPTDIDIWNHSVSKSASRPPHH